MSQNFQEQHAAGLARAATESPHLDYLDQIARKAWAGNYDYVEGLSTGERLYVALASGRMRELAPNASIPYAVDRVGPEWMAHMIKEWLADSQPTT